MFSIVVVVDDVVGSELGRTSWEHLGLLSVDSRQKISTRERSFGSVFIYLSITHDCIGGAYLTNSNPREVVIRNHLT